MDSNQNAKTTPDPSTADVPADPSSDLTRPLPGARSALALMILINLFNYIDRQVLAAVEPDIRRELFPYNPDAGMEWTGLLSTAFLFTYMFAAPVFGWLADRASRWLLVGIGVVLWSLASGASGWPWQSSPPAPLPELAADMVGLSASPGNGPLLAASLALAARPLTFAFIALLLTRCLVGIGEAAYGPVAPTVISDLFPLKIRGRVMAWFYMAIPVGGALGYALGGEVARRWGWRWAFYCVVPPGLLLGILCWFMKDPPRGQADATGPDPTTAMVESAGRRGPATIKDYLILWRIPSYVLNTLGMTAMTFAIGGLAFWMPEYLKKTQAPGWGGIEAVTLFGGLTALGGLAATMAGGIAGDVLRKRFPGSYFLVSGAAMLIGFPMVLLFLAVDFPWAWLFMFLAVFCLFFNTGPTNTIIANVTHPSIRASAFAINIFVIHVLGDAISPPLIGFVSFRFNDMKLGFKIVSVAMLVGGLLWIWGARYLERDTKRAPGRSPGLPGRE